MKLFLKHTTVISTSLLLFACSDPSPTPDVAQNKNQNTVTAPTEIITTTAKEMAKVYEDNQVAGDAKFYKKTIKLTGKLRSIGSGLGNEPYLTLQGTNQFLGVNAHFKNPDVEKISALKKNQTVSLICEGKGAVIGAPMLGECEFAE